MKYRSFRVLSLLLFCILLMPLFIPSVSAESPELPDTQYADHVYFSNLTEGKIIYHKSDGSKISPSSSAKIMTGLVAIELISDKLDDIVTITRDMISDTRGASMNLRAGEKISVRDLMYAAICAGFNDAAYALAATACTTRAEFVGAMNRKAESLGALDTHYTNPTGYDDASMQTTLADTVTIARCAMQNDLYMEISTTSSRKIYIEGRGEITIYNRNALISHYYAQGYINPLAKGLIAGVTDAGYCLVTSATIEGSEYLCIVMSAREHDGTIASYAIANDMLSYAATAYEKITLLPAGTLITTIPVEFAINDSHSTDEVLANVRTLSDATSFIRADTDLSTLKMRPYLFYDSLRAPIVTSVQVGAVDFYLDDNVICTVPLVTNAKFEANEFLLTLDTLKSSVLSRTTLLFIIFTALLVFSYMLIEETVNLKRRRTRRAIRLDISKSDHKTRTNKPGPVARTNQRSTAEQKNKKAVPSKRNLSVTRNKNPK